MPMVRLAQLGCGYWGPNLLRNFSAQAECHVKLVVDQDPKRRSYVESEYPKTSTATDYRAALDDPDIDGVVVATPASTHYGFAKAALEAGKHVFVEKPLAMSREQADDLIAEAAAQSLTLMVGDTFLYNGAVRHLKRLIQDGELGDLYYIYTQRLNLGQVRRDVNAWWNLAPHDVAILLYLMDWELPETVTATGIAYIQPGIEDVVFASLTWANRMTAHIHVSWLDPGKTRRVTVVGNRKMVVYNDVADDKIAVFDKGIDRVPKIGERMDFDFVDSYQLRQRTGDIVLPRIEFQEPLKVETGHFLHCIRTGEPPLTGPNHARSAVCVLEAVAEALKSRRPVELRLEASVHA
jgi:predicted dehydrogenase